MNEENIFCVKISHKFILPNILPDYRQFKISIKQKKPTLLKLWINLKPLNPTVIS